MAFFMCGDCEFATTDRDDADFHERDKPGHEVIEEPE
jgi:hypothetical protein